MRRAEAERTGAVQRRRRWLPAPSARRLSRASNRIPDLADPCGVGTHGARALSNQRAEGESSGSVRCMRHGRCRSHAAQTLSVACPTAISSTMRWMMPLARGSGRTAGAQGSTTRRELCDCRSHELHVLREIHAAQHKEVAAADHATRLTHMRWLATSALGLSATTAGAAEWAELMCEIAWAKQSVHVCSRGGKHHRVPVARGTCQQRIVTAARESEDSVQRSPRRPGRVPA